jgi:hypothetical protein
MERALWLPSTVKYGQFSTGGCYGFDGGVERRLRFKTLAPPLEHNISDGHKQRNDGCGACQRSPCLEPDSLTIAACDVLSLFLAAVRPLLAPSYATFAANVSVAQCYECMLCGHMGLRRLTFLSSKRRLRFKNVAPPPC